MTAASPIPVIDIDSLVDPSRKSESDVAKQIGNAARDVGFFYIRGHRIDQAQMDGVFNLSKAFFEAPDAIKEAVSFTGVSTNRGYIRLKGESLEPGKPPDFKEAFNIGYELSEDDPDLMSGQAFRALNVWPDLQNFRPTMLAYFETMMRIGFAVHRAFSIDLGLEPAFFDDKFKKPMATLRLLHYPPSTEKLLDGQIGAGVHTDYGNLTLLATDSSGGLMVRDRTGRWLDAPVIPGAFVCNIGDCLMRWSNDVYVSTPHKVVTPPGKDRYSIAFFFDPDPDATVACLPGCVTAGQQPKYPPISAAEFLQSRIAPTLMSKAG